MITYEWATVDKYKEARGNQYYKNVNMFWMNRNHFTTQQVNSWTKASYADKHNYINVKTESWPAFLICALKWISWKLLTSCQLHKHMLFKGYKYERFNLNTKSCFI